MGGFHNGKRNSGKIASGGEVVEETTKGKSYSIGFPTQGNDSFVSTLLMRQYITENRYLLVDCDDTAQETLVSDV